MAIKYYNSRSLASAKFLKLTVGKSSRSLIWFCTDATFLKFPFLYPHPSWQKTRSLKTLLRFIFNCVYIYYIFGRYVCEYRCLEGQMHLISWKLKLQPAVCHPMWGLGTKLGSSARASALTHWSISSASSLLLRKQKLPYSSNYFTFLSGIPNILFPFSYQKQTNKKKKSKGWLLQHLYPLVYTLMNYPFFIHSSL